MKREKGRMVWLDNTPAEDSEGALYSEWKIGESTNIGNDNCAYLSIGSGEWNDYKCDYGVNAGPYVLCQK